MAIEWKVLFLKESYLNDILKEYERFLRQTVSYKIYDRESFISDVLFQAMIEMNRRGEIENPLGHLKKCYRNLCRRAKYETKKSNIILKKNVPVDIDKCTLVCGQPTPDHMLILEGYKHQIREGLTARQKEIFDILLEQSDMSNSDLWKDLGYSSEAGLRQIIDRIRQKAMSVIMDITS